MELIPNPIECNEILSEAVCKKLKEAAAKLKIKWEKVNEAIKQALDKGLRKAKDIIAFVRGKMVEWAKNLTCEQIISKPVSIHKNTCLS